MLHTSTPMYSAYMLHPSHGWIGTHRLPLESAIFYCKQYRQQHFDCVVAIVSEGQDAAPILEQMVGRFVRAIGQLA